MNTLQFRSGRFSACRFTMPYTTHHACTVLTRSDYAFSHNRPGRDPGVGDPVVINLQWTGC